METYLTFMIAMSSHPFSLSFFLSSLFPENPEFTRDRGILYCEMEYFSKAMDDLKHYLEVRPQAEDVHEIKKLTQMLKGYREILN